MASPEVQEKKPDHRILPEKEFILRDSLLTKMFRTKHWEAFENDICTWVVFWLAGVAVSYYLAGEEFTITLPSTQLLKTLFENYHLGILAWFKLFLAVLAYYPFVRFWASWRGFSSKFTTFDFFFIIIYLSYQAFFVWITFDVLFANPVLGGATAMAVSMEQVRFILKMWAFTREVGRNSFRAAEARAKKTDGDSTSLSPYYPKLSSFLYFLFVPTIVYRDKYPRNPSINWRFFFYNVVLVVGCFYGAYYVWDFYVQPEFQGYLTQPVTIGTLLKSMFRPFLPFLYLMFFLSFFQYWLNAWGEILRFGDRLFYDDCWNSMNYSEQYRKWNVVNHDWLYTYIYKDSHELFKLRGRVLPAFLVFFVSSIFHEYIMHATLGFFSPAMLVDLSVVSFVGIFMKRKNPNRLDNIQIWVDFFLTYGVIYTYYLAETAARKICPNPANYDNAFVAFVVPRFYTCYGFGGPGH